MKIRMKIIIIVTIMIVVTIIGTAIIGHKKQGDNKNSTIDAIPIVASKVKPTTIENNFFSVSKIEAKKSIVVQASIEGTVEKVFVKAGESIQKGKPLFRIKGEDLQEKLDLSIKQASIQLEQQKISLENVEKTFHDAKILLNEGAIPKNEYIEAEAAFNTAKLNIELANKNYSTAIKSSKTNLEKLMIYSPITGVVADINVKVGELLHPESGVTIITGDKFITKVSATEDLINKINVGTPGEIYLPGKAKIYPAKVTEINQKIDSQSLTYPVTLEIASETDDLKDGMYAEVTICIEKTENQILIPQKAIMFEGDKTYIYKLTDQDKITKVWVQQGIQKDGNVQVTGDIIAGERIVIKGQHFIDEDTKIQIIDSEN